MDLLDDETDYGAKFFNPANDDVQNFVLQLLADLAKYAPATEHTAAYREKYR